MYLLPFARPPTGSVAKRLGWIQGAVLLHSPEQQDFARADGSDIEEALVPLFVGAYFPPRNGFAGHRNRGTDPHGVAEAQKLLSF